MTTVADLVHTELHTAAKTLHNDHHMLVRLAREADGTPVGTLIRRVLEWRADDRKSVWLHLFLSKVVDCTQTGFMSAFTRFLWVAPVSADPSFEIEWVGPTGRALSKDNPRARPRVAIMSHGVDSQSAQLLLSALDVLEHRESQVEARLGVMEGMDDA